MGGPAVPLVGAARPFQIVSLPPPLPEADPDAEIARSVPAADPEPGDAQDAESHPERRDGALPAPNPSTSSADAIAPAHAPEENRSLPDPGAFRTLGDDVSLLEEEPGHRAGVAGFSLPWLDRLDPRLAEFLRVGGALLVVLGLMFMTRMFLKRGGGPFLGAGRPSGVLEILARYPVGRGQSLILLKLARRILLVHQSGGQMRTLAEVSEGNEVAGLLARMEAGSRSREAARFRATLHAFESEHEEVARSRLPASRRGNGDIEVVDLTRSQVSRLGNMLGRRRLRA